MAFYGSFTDGRLSAVFRNGQSIGCCCSVGCCMYSVAALVAGDLTVADLPEKVFVTGDLCEIQQVEYEFLKNEVILTDSSGQAWHTYYKFGDTYIVELIGYDEWWIVQLILVDGEYELTCVNGGASPCLVYDEVGDYYPVRDDFHATYSVTGTLSGTVTRTSLCVWSGTGITLRFNSATQKWNVNGNEKSSGNQSSPDGSYTGGFTVS